MQGVLYMVGEWLMPGEEVLGFEADWRRRLRLWPQAAWLTVTLEVAAGLPCSCRWVVGEEDGQSRDSIDGSLERCDLRQPFSAQVMMQSHPERVEGLVIIHDAFPLSHVGRHSACFGAHRSAAFLALSLLRLAGVTACRAAAVAAVQLV